MLHGIVKVWVVLMVQHQHRSMVQDLPDVVPPCVCILAILVQVEPPSLHVHLTVWVDQPSEPFKEACIYWQAMVVAQDILLVHLARCDIHDSNFVCVNDGHLVQVQKKVRRLDMSTALLLL